MAEVKEKRGAAGLLPGLGACVVIGAAAWCMAKYIPVAGKLIGGPVFAILLGMILAFVKRPAWFQAGITFSGKKILQYSIIFLGFGMDIMTVLKTGGQSLAVMLCTIAASLLTAFLVGRALKVDGNTSILIGVGTSICGGSAIAATAPVIDADDKEVAYSISTIFLFNILAVFIFPALGRVFGMSDTGFGVWAGTAINDTSSVVAAGFSFSDAAGEMATIVKLTRTLMIIPITLILALWRTRKVEKTDEAQGINYSLAKIFPWFVLGFLATAIFNSVGILPPAASNFLNEFGKFGIMVAMAGIGLNTNVKSLFKNGMRPIALGLCCWFAVAVVSLLVQRFVGLV
ncbi:YeiH family protein [Lawsonibacter faecis]|uniref:YeiH family putative sulfate export transporter n=1 Tax=Lawsonibacter faecis TaxID=2763052 RepID=A0A8J6J6H5_9FIRM|nr:MULTISPECIES: YeiH family protein [Oscillospiraceae]MTQ97057.1 putative sulfate exporter family transporter [Pseudoflavonifractor sp. BIOML-A16]MTR06121.1 putative sulfate exporter family transporter [Pseudoflavonifractor sp. BIOML-A15]MTR33688.1 putative sulfate exporter family transporter [Pseudoflavonifractor sp. BIOML-A14]MTR72813.1 putative sulfate exporter family transporter [Pseudoflavonifractor sp. BIOML-A18]MTS63286.1 putative sulfate exporter family transporter [Pseudoflavonifract